jgi:hypothetical protein
MFSLIYSDSRDIREREKLAHTIYFFETPYYTYSYEKARQVWYLLQIKKINNNISRSMVQAGEVLRKRRYSRSGFTESGSRSRRQKYTTLYGSMTFDGTVSLMLKKCFASYADAEHLTIMALH